MTARIRGHFRSNVVGYIALFAFGIGGTAYAVDGPLAGQNTVGSEDIINNEVKSADVSNGRIFNVDIADDIIQSGKVKNDTLTGDDIDESTLMGVDADDANTVDGNSAPELQSRWFLLNEAGVIEAQSGGFSVINAYASNANAYVDAGEDLTDNGLTATIALQNSVDTDTPPDATANPNFSGEVSIARCASTGVVNCVPAGTNNNTTLVVSPRNSDGTATAGTNVNPRKRVYVVVTETAPAP